MSTTVDLAGTDQAIASLVGLFSGYDAASTDLTNRITAAVQNAGLTVASASFAPNVTDINNYLSGAETTIGVTPGEISWSGSIRVTEDGSPDAIVSQVRAAVASVVTSVTSASSGGIASGLTDAATSLTDAIDKIAQTIKTLATGANTTAQVLPWLLIGTAIVFVVVVARNPKALKAFV